MPMKAYRGHGHKTSMTLHLRTSKRQMLSFTLQVFHLWKKDLHYNQTEWVGPREQFGHGGLRTQKF